MDYISTRNTQKTFLFKDVFLKGLAPDGGLFVPKKIPLYSLEDLNKIKNFTYREIAGKIILDFCSDTFNEDEINDLINLSYREFKVKEVVEIKKLGEKNLLELFHGPTLAFKDIALQIIGNMYEKILEKNNLKLNIVVATSGDTGAAAISAIKNRKNMNIFVLHPYERVSEIQRKFMTTVDAKNVFNIALKGDFDDCQKFVKSMFVDKIFSKQINISGVNSINWARIIIQIVYYFYSYFKITQNNEKINFSVPTGNFGDVYAGYVAKKMGLPIDKLIVATNKNDILNKVISTGIYKPKKVEHTISPSMDIQVASNFERLLFDIYSCNSDKINLLMKFLKEKGEYKIDQEEQNIIRNTFLSESISDKETRLIISEVYKNYKILVDPHTAIAIGAMEKISAKGNNVALATAHPFKFSKVVTESTGKIPTVSKELNNILNKKEKYDTLDCDLNRIKKYITERI